MAENEAPKQVEGETVSPPVPETPKAVETKAEPKEEPSLTPEEFVERLRTAGLNPLREALNEYVSRIRQIGNSFLEALEGSPKKKG